MSRHPVPSQPRIIGLVSGRGPLAAAAIHDGHDVRPEVEDLLQLSAADRLREEDGFTAQLAEVAPTRFIGRRSRFEVDLNRPREACIYLEPSAAWDLQIWKAPPPLDLIERSLAEYDEFYAAVEEVLRRLVKENEFVVLFDLHTYNHRRQGPDAPPADPRENPEVNVGTGTMDREYWAPVVEQFITDLRHFNYFGRHLDVRENVKFFGGDFGRWIHQTFPDSVCSLAIEFKKFFIDEWTGQVDGRQLARLRAALRSTIPGILQTLEEMQRARHQAAEAATAGVEEGAR